MGKCKHERRRLAWVRFKDGTMHIAAHCEICGRHRGFVPRTEVEDPTNLPFGITQIQLRKDLGLPTGCIACFAGIKTHLGFCFKCMEKQNHLRVKKLADEKGVSVWKLSKEDIFSIAGELK